MVAILEIWKDIDGYNGYYEVSNLGNVRSVNRQITDKIGRKYYHQGHMMLQHENDDGYLFVKLSKDGHSKSIAVHILVARSFVSGYFDGAEVDHIDADRKNNVYSNLRWLTHADNIHRSIELGNHISLSDMSGANNPNYGNKTLHNKYAMDKELAKEKQGRNGGKNGKSKPIRIILEDETSLYFRYIGECAKYLISNNLVPSIKYRSVCAMISQSAKSMKPYYGIRVELL